MVYIFVREFVCNSKDDNGKIQVSYMDQLNVDFFEIELI